VYKVSVTFSKTLQKASEDYLKHTSGVLNMICLLEICTYIECCEFCSIFTCDIYWIDNGFLWDDSEHWI